MPTLFIFADPNDTGMTGDLSGIAVERLLN